MALSTLHDLFVHELRDIYYAEKLLVKALPKMAKAAESAELATGFKDHLEETKEHVSRIEEIFALLELSNRGAKCDAMEGLVKEGGKMIDEEAEPAVRDAGLIAAAQKVEHYEIASYGTLATYAAQLGLTQAVELLQQTLAEEKACDLKLTELAESQVNAEALSVGAGDESDEE